MFIGLLYLNATLLEPGTYIYPFDKTMKPIIYKS
jgi:hypothetical protein